MAKTDDRLFAPFPIEMDEHPKIIGLSDAAFRAIFEATFYSRRMLSDGFLDERVVLKRWGLVVAEELSANDPERPSWIRIESPKPGWRIHDFEKHHPLRADVERKRADVSAVRSKAGKAGAAKRWQADGKSVANDSSETETETSSSTKKDVAVRPDVKRICELLADRIAGNGSKRPDIGKTWTEAARLLIDRDARPLAEVVSLIDWCQTDSFWKGNILSMPKFREKYDQLRLQREAKAGGKPDGPSWDKLRRLDDRN